MFELLKLPCYAMLTLNTTRGCTAPSEIALLNCRIARQIQTSWMVDFEGVQSLNTLQVTDCAFCITTQTEGNDALALSYLKLQVSQQNGQNSFPFQSSFIAMAPNAYGVAYQVCRQVAARVLTFISRTGLKKS